MELKTWELLLELVLNIKIKFVDNMEFIHVNTQCTQFHFPIIVITIILTFLHVLNPRYITPTLKLNSSEVKV